MRRGEILLLVSFFVATLSGVLAVWLFVNVFGLGPWSLPLSLLLALAVFILFGVIVTKMGM
ncbi:MAG: hypothetical protein KatS3mg107_1091 [Gemmataceae bacterium]|jgi:hypothetical protein|nr:MAG: hypothetical protein KatS3mg107_1091 [Gemmataceae bacterium]